MTDTTGEMPATRGAKTPKERLMEASGVREKGQPPQEFLELGRRMDQSFQALVGEADQALRARQRDPAEHGSHVQPAQEFLQFHHAQGDGKGAGADGAEGVRRKPAAAAGQDPGDCPGHRKLPLEALGFQLGAAPIGRVAPFTGVVLALLAFGAMYHFFFSKSYDETKRYAEWGRKVEAEFRRMPPKHH